MSTYNRLNKDDAAVLLVDHQAGLLSLVRDIDPDRFKNNVLALADMAEYFQLKPPKRLAMVKRICGRPSPAVALTASSISMDMSASGGLIGQSAWATGS